MPINRIVLIYPKRDGRIWGKAHGAPYTLMRLASLAPDSIPVEIWDENLMRLPLETLRPGDLVGATAMSLGIDQVREHAQIIHKQGAAVVVGGTHATLVPDEVEQWADAVVVGEAYRTWPQIIRDFDAGSLRKRYTDEEWADLKGVSPISDRVIRMMDEHRNYWVPMLEITRGCPRNCSFCTAIRVSGKIMRHRPIPEVIDEIRRRRLKRFFLTDDNFGLNFRTDPAYSVELFEALRKEKLHSWTAQAEMMVGNYPELLDLAREAHLDKFFIGFESVNASNRKELGGKSHGKVEEYRRTIKTMHAHGLSVVGLFVFGFDGDTPSVFQDTWNFVRESELDSVSVTILTPYPGTPQREDLIKQGRLFDQNQDGWRKYDVSHVVFQPAQMTPEQLFEGYDWICKKLYNPLAIGQRGFRTLRRYPLQKARTKFFSSFSTDLGYKKTYDWRYA